MATPRIPPEQRLTHEQLVVVGRASAHARWSMIPAAERPAATAAARAARWQKYLDAVPERVTDPEERAALAEQARRADMLRMTLAASKARRAKAARRRGQAVPDDEDAA